MKAVMPCKRISIRFCGGCNPRIDRGDIAREVREQLEKLGFEVGYNTVEADLAVYLSGCSSNCSHRYCEAPIPGVVVAATTVNAWPIDERDLPSEIVRRVRDVCERLERDLQEPGGTRL